MAMDSILENEAQQRESPKDESEERGTMMETFV